MEISLRIDLSSLTLQQHGALLSLIGEAPGADEPVDLDNDQLDELVQDMLDQALENPPGSQFRIPELYRQARPEATWNSLSPSDRKILGRRFKKAVDAQWEEEGDGPYIHLSGKTIQNSAIYTVKTNRDD